MNADRRSATSVIAAVVLTSLAWAHPSTLPHLLLAQASPVVPAAAEKTVPLILELTVDGGEPVAGLVRITSLPGGRVLDRPAHLRRPMGWLSLPARATVHVPAGELQIEACHGIETTIVSRRITVGGDARPAPVRLALRRFYDPRARKLAGANTHLHLMLHSPRSMGGADLRSRAEAEEYLATTARSDALDLIYVSHLERAGANHNYVSNEFARADFARWSDPRLQFVNGEEHRHEGGRSPQRAGADELRYGHVLFLDLPRLVEPASYGAIFSRGEVINDAIPMRRAISTARSLGATIVWCHGRQGTEDVANWIDGLLHAQNIFDGGNDGSFDVVYYPYLNAGMRVPFSTGTDWGVYDFSRVYVPMHEPASSAAFRRQLTAGRSFITNGTFIEFEAENGTPGDTIELDRPRPIRIRGHAIGRDDFERIEVVFNGSIVAQASTRRVQDHVRADIDQAIDVREPGWFALRIPPGRPYNDRSQYGGAGANLFGKALFAHTSAVYVNIGGKRVSQPAAALQLVKELESAIATIQARGAFANDAEREQLLRLYRDAMDRVAAPIKARNSSRNTSDRP